MLYNDMLTEKIVYAQEAILQKLEMSGHAFIDVNYDKHALLIPLLTAYAKASLKILSEEVISSTNPRKLKRLSLSETYGLSEFPLHTDRAHDIIPPRFVLLSRYSGTAHATTRVMMLTVDCILPSQSAALRRDVWHVLYGKQRFLTSIINETIYPLHPIMRYDACCMKPAISPSKSSNIMNDLISRETKEYELTQEKTLILDNWKVMHGRSHIEVPQGLRSIQRTLISIA